MSDYVASEQELIDAYAEGMYFTPGISHALQASTDEARRGIAKIKADALREWSGQVQMELAASASHGIDLGEKYLHGAHSMLRQAGEFADRTEEAINDDE